MTSDKKFVFSPKYYIRNRNDLYQLLKTHEIKGLGGIYFDDVDEAIKDADKVVKVCGFASPLSTCRALVILFCR